jgi:Na+(H+)/acetate symporter ActP
VLRGRWKDLRLAAVLSAVLPIAMALTVVRLDLGLTVPLVFAVAASTFCPLLVLGIWWRGLTAPGAIAGLIGGGLCAGVAPVITIWTRPEGWFGLLAEQPAAWSVPIGFALMIGVSLATRHRLPADVSRTMVRLHAPEGVDLQR